MRHKDQPTAIAALEAWKRLRAKVEAAGGDNYAKPVLVQFLDANTFEVMDRDIVEDEFYVLRKYRVLRDLDPAGQDLEEAIRQARGSDKRQGQSRRQAPRRNDVKAKTDGKGKDGKRKRRRRGARRGGAKKGKPPQA